MNHGGHTDVKYFYLAIGELTFNTDITNMIRFTQSFLVEDGK